MGIAGFIVGLISLFMSGSLGVCIAMSGLILSSIGINGKYRKLGLGGLTTSVIALLTILILHIDASSLVHVY